MRVNFYGDKKEEEKRLFNYDPSDGVNIRQAINESLGYIEYGAQDSFPNFVVDKVSKSHTGMSCLDTFTSFLEGDSISYGDIIVNNTTGETFGSIHHKVCSDFTFFEGAFVLVEYNLNKQPSGYRHLPFEYCRLGVPDEFDNTNHVYFNPYFGTPDYKEAETIIFPIYNQADPVIESQILTAGFRGQVIFFKEEKPNARTYPIPYYWACHYWLDVQRKIGEFHNTNIDNNFMLSSYIKIVGDPDEAIERDSKGNTTLTAGEAFNNHMNKNFSGSAKGGNVMALWSDDKEGFPEIGAFPNNANDKLFETLQKISSDIIIEATNVPPELANVPIYSGLAGGKKIEESFEVMNSKVVKKQRFLENNYNMIFKNSIFNIGDITISQLKWGDSETEEGETTKDENSTN